jgi:hypothetical protein
MTEFTIELVEKTVGGAIRVIRSDDREALERCDSELQRVEALLLSGEPDSDAPDLLAQIRSTRVFLAADVGDSEAVLRQSGEFLKDCPLTSLDCFNVFTLRLRTLHASGHHREELREALEATMNPEIHGEHLILILEGLATRHPGSLAEMPILQEKIRTTLSELRMTGYTNLPSPAQENMDLDRTALDAAEEIRRNNQARATAFLTDYDS